MRARSERPVGGSDHQDRDHRLPRSYRTAKVKLHTRDDDNVKSLAELRILFFSLSFEKLFPTARQITTKFKIALH